MTKSTDKKFLMGFLLIFSLFLLCMSLFGCATPASSMLNAKISAVPYLNPDINKRASPIVLTIFQLSNSTIFNHATFFALDDNASEALGNTLIDKAVYEIQPEQKTIVNIPLSAKAYFIGVIAAYNNLDDAKWREVFAISPDKGRKKVEISLTTQGVMVGY